MPDIRYPGLRGSHPSSFLAALGLVVVAHRQGHAVRLSWIEDGGDPVACFSADGEIGLVNDVIGTALKQGTGVPGWERTGVKTAPAKVDPHAFRDLANSMGSRAVHDPAFEDAWLSALGSDLRTASTGAVGASGFFALSGNQQLAGVVAKLESKLTSRRKGERRVNTDQITEVLKGRWTYVEDTNSLGFDPAGAVSGALDGKSAETSAVPILAWLAYHALPLLPTFGQQTTAIVRRSIDGGSRRESAFVWPVWHGELGLHAIKMLLSSSHVARLATGGQDARGAGAWQVLEAMGVWRAYASRHESYGQGYGRFHLPDEIGRADVGTAGRSVG